MSVSPSVAAKLLARATASDNRTPSEAAVLAWAESLDDVVNVKDGSAAIAAHYGRTRDFVMPSDINAGVKAIRKTRTDAMQPVDPPSALDGIPARENAWVARYRRAVGDGLDVTDAYAAACAALDIAPHAIESGGRPVKRRLAQIAASTTLPRDVVQGARRDVANEVRR